MVTYNQHNMKKYSSDEINNIVSLYENGMSFTKIGVKLKRQKNTIKNILIDKGVWVEGKNKIKKEFTDDDINKMKNLYLNKKLSCNKISIIFEVSRPTIVNILKNNGLKINSKSSGKKIILSSKQREQIENLYLKENKNTEEISKTMGFTKSYISKYLNKSGYRRDKSLGTSIGMVKKNRNIHYNEYLNTLTNYGIYKSEVLSVTNKQPIEKLKNYDKRGVSGIDGVYHLDHKFSIIEGFKQNIKPEIIGNINNLEFIPWKENLSKGSECSITIDKII